VGYVTPDVTIQIVDQAGAILPPDQEGSIRLRSAFAIDRYFRNSEESAQVFRDGWFYPGDLGRLSAEGLLFIYGREQAMLNIGGDKVSPEPIEQILAQFSGVTDAGVFAVPNEYGNNEIGAAIASRGTIDQQSIKQYCTARLPQQFVPSKFYFVASLPRNEMGKLDRSGLHDWLSHACKGS
jgi:long-chain acyl-CoA synthetase